MRILVRNGRLLDGANGVDRVGTLAIAYGEILTAGETPADFTPDLEIDATDRIVAPGLVDLAARLREPGHEHKATIASESEAAVAAGITTLCCLPDTQPVIDTPAVVELIRRRALAADRGRVLPVGALTRGLAGEQLSEMAALKQAGCVAVMDVVPLANSQILRRALEYASTWGLLVCLTPEDPWLAEGGCAHEGAVATRLGLPGIPASAESAALARDLALVETTGARTHFCRLSTARGVEKIRRAKAEGLPVTADVAAHQLFLTEADVEGFRTECHVRPPLRSEEDRQALREAVADGTIDAICSDHQPHEADAKLAPFCATEPGLSALETLLPLTLRLAEEGLLPLAEALQRVTAAPARILGSVYGTLEPGSPADVVIIDPAACWTLSDETLRSRGRNTPFLDTPFTGRATHVIVDGRLTWQEA